MISRLPLLATAVALVGAGLLGAVLAVAGAAVHRLVWRPGELAVPWGLALALATPVVCGVAVAVLARSRGVPAAFAAGWLVVVFLVLRGRPEGDFAFAGDALGWSFLVLGVLAMGVVLAAALFRPAQPGNGSADR